MPDRHFLIRRAPLAAAAILATWASAATAAPMIEQIGLVNGPGSATVSYQNLSGYQGGEIQVNTAGDGSDTGAWVTSATLRSDIGTFRVSLDASLLSDGEHQVRLVARDATGQVVYRTPFNLLADQSAPVVLTPVVSPRPGFLAIAVSASDPQSGIDLTVPVGVEVADYDPATSQIISTYRPLGVLATGESGVGVAHSLAPGHYVARVKITNTRGMASFSPPAWFTVKAADDADPGFPVTVSASARRSAPGQAGKYIASRYQRVVIAGSVRGANGAPLSLCRVVVRSASGRGYVTRSDRDGRFYLPVRLTHGGVFTVSAVTAGRAKSTRVQINLTTPSRGGQR